MAFFEQCWQQDNDSRAAATADADPDDSDMTKSRDGDAEPPLSLSSSDSMARKKTTTERAMYTIVAVEDDTTVLAWTHTDMKALLERSVDMRASLTRAMIAAIVSKVVGFTSSRKASVAAGPYAWLGRLWPEAAQGGGPVVDYKDGPPKVLARKPPVFSVPEDKR